MCDFHEANSSLKETQLLPEIQRRACQNEVAWVSKVLPARKNDKAPWLPQNKQTNKQKLTRKEIWGGMRAQHQV
jgi:hypothetical protein